MELLASFDRHEMAEQIRIGHTCHVASDTSDIGFAFERPKEGGERKEGKGSENRATERPREGGSEPLTEEFHPHRGIVISDIWNQWGDRSSERSPRDNYV